MVVFFSQFINFNLYFNLILQMILAHPFFDVYLLRNRNQAIEPFATEVSNHLMFS